MQTPSTFLSSISYFPASSSSHADTTTITLFCRLSFRAPIPLQSHHSHRLHNLRSARFPTLHLFERLQPFRNLPPWILLVSLDTPGCIRPLWCVFTTAPFRIICSQPSAQRISLPNRLYKRCRRPPGPLARIPAQSGHCRVASTRLLPADHEGMTATKVTRKVYSAEELHRLRGSQSQPKLHEAIEERDGEDAEIVKGEPTIDLSQRVAALPTIALQTATRFSPHHILFQKLTWCLGFIILLALSFTLPPPFYSRLRTKHSTQPT